MTSENTVEKENRIDPLLLRSTIKLNTILLASMCGAVTGIFLLIATYISLGRGSGADEYGHYLNLLGHFMPGYNVSASGAWIGLLWGFIYGTIAGTIVYRIYAKTIPQQVEDLIARHQSYQDIDYVVLRLNGTQFGIAMGSLLALGLFAATNWLVLKSTGHESVHMALLSNYLPGYTVSFVGSIIGAVDTFIIVYAGSLLLSFVYNKIVSKRHKV